jgi:peptidoglycan/xylan/chitin deacetylase (PgdA/CDA1 family)
MEQIQIINKPIVFMYHGIIKEDAEIPPHREAGADIYDLSLKKFYEQMEYLKRQNCPVVPYTPKKVPAVILTFDDGEMNNSDEAWPVLKMCRFPAYFFITVNRVGHMGYMGWKEIKALSDAGMIIGSHGMNHEILTNLNADDLKKELLDSKVVLEQNLRKPVKDFSVPRGFYNEAILKTAKEVGYENVFVSDEKPRSPLAIGRIAVQGWWPLKRFQMALEGQKPWDEEIVDFFKENTKRLLGGRGYNSLRSFLLKSKK